MESYHSLRAVCVITVVCVGPSQNAQIHSDATISISDCNDSTIYLPTSAQTSFHSEGEPTEGPLLFFIDSMSSITRNFMYEHKIIIPLIFSKCENYTFLMTNIDLFEMYKLKLMHCRKT